VGHILIKHQQTKNFYGSLFGLPAETFLSAATLAAAEVKAGMGRGGTCLDKIPTSKKFSMEQVRMESAGVYDT